MARYDFGITLYVAVDGLRHHHDGPPVLHDQSAAACRPCYSGGKYGTLSFSHSISIGLLHLTTGSASTMSYEATYRFTCVTACNFALGKLTTPDYSDAASRCYKGIRTTPSAGLKPARLIAVNGIRSGLLL